jgi:hypothetical protein
MAMNVKKILKYYCPIGIFLWLRGACPLDDFGYYDSYKM